MKRIAVRPRRNFRETVRSQGLYWDETDSGPYWNEDAAYELTSDEVDSLEAATNELHTMCLNAAEYVIVNKAFDQFGVDHTAAELVKRSWDAEPPSVYGRFDLAFRDGQIKLLEYNADTPTVLLESAVIQWYWLQDVKPEMDQFNSIHERLVAKWKEMGPYLDGNLVHLTSLDNVEDSYTVAYMEDVLQQAGFRTQALPVRDIGMSPDGIYGDMQNREMRNVFKLYPWEWMLRDAFGSGLLRSTMKWIEPAWKMLLSNKAILKVLWDMYPGHPYLLPASYEPLAGDHVKKPRVGREGEGISVYLNGSLAVNAEDSAYGERPYMYQEYFELPCFDGCRPVIGSWVIGHEEGNCSAGIGIREARGLITGNASQFVPHYFTAK